VFAYTMCMVWYVWCVYVLCGICVYVCMCVWCVGYMCVYGVHMWYLWSALGQNILGAHGVQTGITLLLSERVHAHTLST